MKIGYDRQQPEVDLLLLVVYLGLGFIIGVLAQGYIIIKDSKSCSICRRCLCQANCLACGALTLLLLLEKDYDSLALYAWGFGIFCGGYYYTLKMYTYELVKFKIMERAWGFVSAAQCLPILIGSPISCKSTCKCSFESLLIALIVFNQHHGNLKSTHIINIHSNLHHVSLESTNIMKVGQLV